MAKKNGNVEKKVPLQIGQLQTWTKGSQSFLVLEAKKGTDEVIIQKVSGDRISTTRSVLRESYTRVEQ